MQIPSLKRHTAWCGPLQMDMKSGVLNPKNIWDGESSRTMNPTLPSWRFLTQLEAHQEDSPGNPLVATKLQTMDGYLALVGSNSSGCLLIVGCRGDV